MGIRFYSFGESVMGAGGRRLVPEDRDLNRQSPSRMLSAIHVSGFTLSSIGRSVPKAKKSSRKEDESGSECFGVDYIDASAGAAGDCCHAVGSAGGLALAARDSADLFTHRVLRVSQRQATGRSR
jgi:hypothetical protein